MNEDVEHSLESLPEKNLDGLIDIWAPVLRDEMTADGRLGSDDFRGMHRTALISIARLREVQARAKHAHQDLARLGLADMIEQPDTA